MMVANVWHFVVVAMAQWGYKRLPVLTLRWQNRCLFASPIARVLRGLALCLGSMLLLPLFWSGLVTLAQLQSPSVQWQVQQTNASHLAQQLSVQQTQFAVAQVQLNADRTRLLQQQTAVDDLILAWPNANFRRLMLTHLQQMAQQRGLQVLDLKTSNDAPLHGFEASSLRFNVRGSEDGAQAYWQALNQLFQNGVWVSWIFRLLPNGQTALEGHLQLLWDADDAFTDTGVELLDVAVLATHLDLSPSTVRKGVDDLAHVLPAQSPQSMQVVGSARPSSPALNLAAWTWIRSDAQIHLVQSGQRVGLEKYKAGTVDDHGLWLVGETGRPATQLSWEVVKP